MVLFAILATALSLAAAPTNVTVTYHAGGAAGLVSTWRLACAPARGTHPTPGRACLELAAPAAAAELAPATKACRFLPPPTAPFAAVRGTLHGKPVERLLRPACEPAAWRDLHFLLTGA